MTEFFPNSFEIRDCEYGVGVFATQDIPRRAFLRLCPRGFELKALARADVPEEYVKYCIVRPGEVLLCPWEDEAPQDLSKLPMDSYLNHSNNPNTKVRMTLHGVCLYIAVCDIASGEQVLINYNNFGEPVEAIEPYYNPEELAA